ncbi:MAG: pseudouridine-5'-phosphate glycosidase [Gemmatimonadaceae bacterium]
MPVIRLVPEIQDALAHGLPIVALETSVLAQGLPIPANQDAARRMLGAVESVGARPAFTAVIAGTPSLGLTGDELARFLARQGVSKVSSRDLGVVMARGGDGATTVAAALTLCRLAGVQVFATGGIGGVHREPPFDESADLVELSRTSAVVVCAGAKSILDLPATVERLESLGVAVVGFRTSEWPGFHYAETGISLPNRCESVGEIVATFRRQRDVGHPAALLVVQPPPATTALGRREVEQAIEVATEHARHAGIRGAALTPFLLAAVETSTSGRSLSVNLSLLEANARLAGEIATELGGTHL